jgi:clan AA aspartic protease
MITGSVNAHREPILRLTVRGAAGQELEVEGVIDTGFSGSISLPSALIATLGLAWRRRGRALLADGSESVFDIYESTVVWDGQPRRVAVDAADTDPLIGMSLLYGYELTIHAIAGGSVTIKELP